MDVISITRSSSQKPSSSIDELTYSQFFWNHDTGKALEPVMSFQMQLFMKAVSDILVNIIVVTVLLYNSIRFEIRPDSVQRFDWLINYTVDTV